MLMPNLLSLKWTRRNYLTKWDTSYKPPTCSSKVTHETSNDWNSKLRLSEVRTSTRLNAKLILPRNCSVWREMLISKLNRLRKNYMISDRARGILICISKTSDTNWNKWLRQLSSGLTSFLITNQKMCKIYNWKWTSRIEALKSWAKRSR